MTDLVLGPVLRHVSEHTVTVWVETAAPCEVEILGRSARTFTAHGHHYALVIVDGLDPGSCIPYQVRLDGQVTWPLPDTRYPPSVIRTLRPDRPVRLVFGSCRHGTPEEIGKHHGYDADALDTYALRMVDTDPADWPDALLLLGDQVYADETSPRTQQLIGERRPLDAPPGPEVAGFDEYTMLYRESWLDPDVRWLLSTVPSAMIFDDHDIRDDWNTSQAWREKMQATSWWRARIRGGLASYWVYQHLGNLSPAELATDPIYSRLADYEDAGQLLDSLAEAADREIVQAIEDEEQPGNAPVRWSYRLDFGRVRLVMVDTRCGRVLPETGRAMLGDADFDWIAEQLRGDYDHLLIGSSLPWLLPPAIHHVESWDEAVCAGAHGAQMARVGERLRQIGDLEHWASFRASFDRLTGLIAAVARGEHGPTPASICVLSGDVHHAYVAQARFRVRTAAPVYQLTCSPVHNAVPSWMKLGFVAGWSRLAAAAALPLARLAGVRELPVRWRKLAGPYFGNAVATLVLDGRTAHLELERVKPDATRVPRLTSVLRMPLAPRLGAGPGKRRPMRRSRRR